VILLSHADAVSRGVGAAPREANTPAGWPGTFVPNLSDRQLGDVVLIEGSGALGLAIQSVQAAAASPMTRLGWKWTHAAIYIGNGEVIDATFHAGVVRQSLWNYCQYRALTVRRVPHPNAVQIAVDAVGHIGKKYATFQPLWAALGWPAAQSASANALFCSTFVAVVVAQATQIALDFDPLFQPLFPGALARHHELDAVTVAWRNI
jgi:hypothetical protein